MFQRVVRRLRLTQESGQALVEYAMIIGLIAAGLLSALTTFADPVQVLWNKILDGVTQATSF